MAVALVRAQPGQRDRFATVNGLRLHYLEWGDPAKPPMILLHGIARHAHTFDHIAPIFARDHHVIALDMRGHGDSAWSPEGAYLVQDYVRDLEALVAQLRLPRPDAARQLDRRPRRAGVRGPPPGSGRHGLSSKTSGPERPQNIADAFARRVEQEANGLGVGRRARRAARGRRTGGRRSRCCARTRTSASSAGTDGRLVWKRDPNLVKGFVETELWDPVSQDHGARALRHRRRQPHRAARDAAAAERHAAATVRIVVMPGLGHYPNEEDTAGS